MTTFRRVILGCSLLFACHLGLGQQDSLDRMLMNAAGEGDSDEVKGLLERGGSVHFRNEYGETPLHVSAIKGNEETIKALLEGGAYVNAKTKNGNGKEMTPLHWMVYPNYIHGVRLLLDAGADPNLKNEDGDTPLDMAVDMGEQYAEIQQLLRDRGGQGGRVVNKEGQRREKDDL